MIFMMQRYSPLRATYAILAVTMMARFTGAITLGDIFAHHSVDPNAGYWQHNPEHRNHVGYFGEGYDGINKAFVVSKSENGPLKISMLTGDVLQAEYWCKLQHKKEMIVLSHLFDSREGSNVANFRRGDHLARMEWEGGLTLSILMKHLNVAKSDISVEKMNEVGLYQRYSLKLQGIQRECILYHLIGGRNTTSVPTVYKLCRLPSSQDGRWFILQQLPNQDKYETIYVSERPLPFGQLGNGLIESDRAAWKSTWKKFSDGNLWTFPPSKQKKRRRLCQTLMDEIVGY